MSINIFRAAAKGKLTRVKSLLASEPETVEAKGDEGRTPLFLAAKSGHKDVVHLLISNGANVNQKTSVIRFAKRWRGDSATCMLNS